MIYTLVHHTESHSPVLGLDPAGQSLSDVHGEVIVIQMIHMFQESDLQLLDLLPLAHAAVRIQTHQSVDIPSSLNILLLLLWFVT